MKIFLLGLMASLMLALVGCGGSGTSVNTAAVAGSYRSNFTRATASVMLLVVDAGGGCKVAISDATGPIATGTGSVNNDGSFVATATGNGIPLITIAGTVASDGTLNATLTGGIAQQVTGTKVAAAGVSPFVGTYAVNYVGSETGTATMTVANDGTIGGNVDIGLTIVGVLTSVGETTAGSNGTVQGSPATITWGGTFFLSPTGPQIKGTWGATLQGQHESGTWNGATAG